MAASITFDFLSVGAGRVAGDLRRTGDNAALAAKGAKVLSDAIEKLGKKEDRTAAESKILASALRQTGEAEDRVAARAVLADAAIRRLDDAMQDSTKHSGELGKALGGLKLNPGLVGPLLALAPAIATANGTKQSVAYKAEQIAIGKAYANLSPAQIALSKQLGGMASAWDAVKAAQTPVVAGALQPWLKSVTDLTKNLAPIIAHVSPVIRSLGVQFDALVNSSAFRDFVGSTGSAAVSAAGSTLIDFVKGFIILLPKFDPLIREAVGWISRLGPAVLTWASSKKAADDITRFLQWFSKNGPVVGQLLKNIGGALKAMAPGLTSGGMAELQAMSAFFAFVAKLPPGVAKPLFEVAGALLLLNKLGVFSVGVKLIGMDAAKAAAAGGAAGMWGKLLPGVRLAGGALVAVVAVDMILKNTPSGAPGSGKNWWENPFGADRK